MDRLPTIPILTCQFCATRKLADKIEHPERERRVTIMRKPPNQKIGRTRKMRKISVQIFGLSNLKKNAAPSKGNGVALVLVGSR